MNVDFHFSMSLKPIANLYTKHFAIYFIYSFKIHYVGFELLQLTEFLSYSLLSKHVLEQVFLILLHLKIQQWLVNFKDRLLKSF